MLRKNKYHNVKVYVGGERYDSRKESKRAIELGLMARGGLIRDLRRQVPFVLQEGYTSNQGAKVRPIYYNADFVYFDVERNMLVVEDVKSPATRTQVYKLKKKLFEAKYREYLFLET